MPHPQNPSPRRTDESIIDQDERRKRAASAPVLPRILFVDYSPALNAGDRALFDLIASLDCERYVPLVVLFADSPLMLRFAESGIKAYVVPFAPSGAETHKSSVEVIGIRKIKNIVAVVALIVKLAKFIRHYHIHIVHTNSPRANIVGGFAARLARVAVLWQFWDRIETDDLPPSGNFTLCRLCQWLPNYVIMSSYVPIRTLKFKPNQPPIGITVGKHGRSFRQHIQDRLQHALVALGDRPYQEPATHVGIVGRLTSWKGQHVFLRAAALVRERFPLTVFQIIGAASFEEQAYEAELKALVATLGLTENVEFIGFRRDVSKLIAHLDVLVHASTVAEPLGQIVLAGMSAGKPVVATEGGGVSEIVVDGVTGLLVPTGDSRAMADAICSLLANQAMADLMGERGFERACTHFAINQTIDQTIDQTHVPDRTGVRADIATVQIGPMPLANLKRMG